MIGRNRILTTLKQAIKRAGGDQVSICLFGQARRVMRFAFERVHQELYQESVAMTVKVIHHGRVGVASTNLLDAAHLHDTIATAAEIARHAPKPKVLAPLPTAQRLSALETYFPETASCSSLKRLALAQHLFHRAKRSRVQLAGSFATGASELAVVNSSGLACYQPMTSAGMKIVAMREGASASGRSDSGYASATARRLSDLDAEAALETAMEKCLLTHRRGDIPLGSYRVLLEPEAVAEVLNWLGYIGFGAKAFRERTSFLAGRIGEPLMKPAVTIYDDGTEPQGLPLLFDFEGVPKRRTMLIERGVARGLVYDTHYGALFGRPSTGHGASPDDVEGPLPWHLCMVPGSLSQRQLLERLDRGVLVTRFHYVNGLLNPREALMTGLTRDGTFWVEGGRVKHRLPNLRFTQSILSALAQVIGVGRERKCVADITQELGAAVVPTLLIDRFAFTGKSKE